MKSKLFFRLFDQNRQILDKLNGVKSFLIILSNVQSACNRFEIDVYMLYEVRNVNESTL